MSSRAQKEALRAQIARGEVDIPMDRFERVTVQRVRCRLCHAIGLGMAVPGASWNLSPWQIPHVQDHPVACRCGLSFLSPGHLNQHVKADRWPWRALEHGPNLS